MKTKEMLILLLAIAVCSSAYAAGSRDGERCQKTTRKCGTVVVKPSDGYGGQCEGKTRKTGRKCGGCGKRLLQRQGDK